MTRKEVALTLVEESNRYIKLFDGLISISKTSKLDNLLYSFGLKIVANRIRLWRIRKTVSDMNKLKREAKDILERALKHANRAMHDAQELNELSIGKQVKENPRLEVAYKDLESSYWNRREVIEFVKQYSLIDYPPDHIAWSNLDLGNIYELTYLSLDDRIRVHEEWKTYIEALNKVEKSRRLIDELNNTIEWTYFLEAVCRHYIEIYSEELERVEDRFELFSILLRSYEFSRIEMFFQQDVGRSRIRDLVDDLDRMKAAINEWET